MGPRISSLVLVALSLGLGAPARAQADDPETAVRLAKSAFEYRDFARVVTILDPWLHPPRIVDPALEVKARELMGVSKHVLGKVPDAEEEFAQLLKLAPKHELDPFLVPPPVVQSFEEVRAKMKPILDALVDRAPDPPPKEVEVRTTVELVEVPHPAVLFAPLGIPQFAMDEPAWGLMWAGLQLAGLALNALGWVQGDRERPGSAQFQNWNVVQYSGLTMFVGAWVGSGLHGYSQLQARRAAALPPQPEGATVSWTWSF